MAEENEKKEFQINTDVDPLTSLLVSDVLNKNNITEDQKANISDDQRRMILKLVEDLQKKANDFVEQQQEKKRQAEAAKQAEEVEPEPKVRPKRNSLRERIQQRRDAQRNND
ncbi:MULTISPECIES: spore coat protein [Bacillus]|uniref:spore coat protein n=1 Tax=Bacillus TaxID=1386 RepID=UPI000DAF3E40|nr:MULTISPECIES: spore coat protein [Bacillus]MBG9819092.1 spore coat protein [Bacillus safensis]QRY39031.1 spore coat protein [Bacillus sp. PDNC022]UQZ92453.1 spore coat protein [Bacillus safensis]WAT81921.1 spore coat protein [Bacillus safensis]WCL56519.1 spore coat protein [Bacillus safensis]